MFGSRHGKYSVRQLSSAGRFILPAICALSFSVSASATWVGMLSDNGGDRISVFNADTDAIQQNFAAAPGMATGDCAVSSDQQFGVTTNSSSLVSFINLGESAGPAASASQVHTSNLAVDMALSPDNRFLVTAGGGALEQPLSVISMEERREVSTSGPFTDHTSVEFCDDGTLLVTTTNGEYFGSRSGNALYDAGIDNEGEISLKGHRLSSGAQPNNAVCAPGSKSGVMLDREGGLTSFTLPGLIPADQVDASAQEVISASFSSNGRRLYVRTARTVEAYDFDPATGEMTLDWNRSAPYSSPYFGMDQIAVHPVQNKLYVDGGDVLMILDTENGEQFGSINAGDATGVCFAKAPMDLPGRMASSPMNSMTTAP